MKLHKHDYSIFVRQQIIAGGMDKIITRKCAICGKLCVKNIDGWYRYFKRRNRKVEESR